MHPERQQAVYAGAVCRIEQAAGAKERQTLAARLTGEFEATHSLRANPSCNPKVAVSATSCTDVQTDLDPDQLLVLNCNELQGNFHNFGVLERKEEEAQQLSVSASHESQ